MRHQLRMYGALRAWIASIPRPRVHADVEELVNEGGFSSRGSLDASSVEMRSVEVREETFLCSDLRAPGQVWRVRRRCRL